MCNGESMGILAGINARRSCRAYQKTPLSPELLKSVLEYATFAPSAKNTQPWEVYVVSGKKLDELREECSAALAAGHTVPMDDSGYSEAGRLRARELFKDMVPFAERQGWDPKSIIVHSVRVFDAPAAAFVCVEKDASPARLIDAGLFVQTLCLSATGHGLGNCVIGYINVVEPVVRKSLGLPENQRLLLAVALGFADAAAPMNEFESSRAELEENVRFIS